MNRQTPGRVVPLVFANYFLISFTLFGQVGNFIFPLELHDAGTRLKIGAKSTGNGERLLYGGPWLCFPVVQKLAVWCRMTERNLFRYCRDAVVMPFSPQKCLKIASRV